MAGSSTSDPREAPDAPTSAAASEPVPRRGEPASRAGLGLAAKVRAHKLATAAIAVAGFLGLGGIFGQWAVNRIGDAVRGDVPPRGFNELHSAWHGAARLNERLVSATAQTNRDLARGTSWTGRSPPPELADDLDALRRVRRGASELVGRVRATSTELTGPRADLVRLVTLIRDTAHLVQTQAMAAYQRYGGQPMSGGSGGFAPVFSNELRDHASRQDGVVRQLAAGLAPTARRFQRPVPRLRGWNRLVYPYAESDTPTY